MRTDWPTAHPPSDRDQLRKARDAAEALFRPHREGPAPAAPPAPATPAVSAAAVPAEMPASPPEPAPRQPRIIVIPPAMPLRSPEPARAAETRPRREKAVARRPRARIAAAEHGRIRTLATYGMTLDEVAELYGVPVTDIERIVGTAG